MLEKEILNLASEYAKKVMSKYKPENIILYGSYADGSATKHSDIDIAVIFGTSVEDWLLISSDLWRLAYEVSALIEPILLFAEPEKDKSGFTAEIVKNGIKIA